MHGRVLPYLRIFNRTLPGGLASARAQSADWCVSAKWSRALLGPLAPQWFALRQHESAELIKEGRQRSVWGVPLDQGGVVAKVADVRSPKDRLKALVLGHPVEREWRAARSAELAGVPVVRPLACGVAGPRGVLVTQRVEGAISLDAFGRSPSTLRLLGAGSNSASATRRRVIEAVAALFARAHARGFFHRDAHPANVLISCGAKGELTAVFADPLGAGFVDRAASRLVSARSLAQLFQGARRFTTRSERYRFLRDYLRCRFGPRGASRGAVHAWLAALLAASTRHAEGLAKKRDRRMRRRSPHFSSIRLPGGWRGCVCTKLERRHVFPQPGVADRDPDIWWTCLHEVLGTIGGGYCSGPFRIGDLEFEMRRPASRWDAMRWLVVGSPARAAFSWCHRQRHRDVSSRLILGYVDEWVGGRIKRCMEVRAVS